MIGSILGALLLLFVFGAVARRRGYSLGQGVEKLLRSPPASLRSPWRAHVPPRTLRAPGPTAPRIWACSRRFSVPYWEGHCRRPRLLMRQALLTVLLLCSTGAFAGELQISFQPSSVLLGSGASVSVAVRLPRADARLRSAVPRRRCRWREFR